MKKIITAGVAALALTLTACGGADGTVGVADAETSTTSAAPSTSTPPSAETTSPEETTPTTTSPVAATGYYPAQADMTQLGANVDRINGFQDKRGNFWVCDKAKPHGNPEGDFYNTPNGCAGPYGSQEEASLGPYRALYESLSEEFGLEGDFDDYLTQAPTPTPRSGQDIADGIARDLGCESAVFNEEIQGYEYLGCS